MRLVAVTANLVVASFLVFTGCGTKFTKESKEDPRPTTSFQDKVSARVNSYFKTERTKIINGFQLSNVRLTQVESMKLLFWERPEGVPVNDIENYFRKIEVMNADLPEMETWVKDVDVVSRVYLLHRQLDALSAGWASYFDSTIANLKKAYLDYTSCEDAKIECYETMAKEMIRLVGEARKGDD